MSRHRLPRAPTGLPHRITRLALTAPRRVLVVAALFMAGAAAFGMPVVSSLAAGGFQDPASESSRANDLLRDTFGRGDGQLVFAVTDPRGADSAQARAAGQQIAARLTADPNVVSVASPWTSAPQAAATLTSVDGRTGLVVADLTGGETGAPRHAAALADDIGATVAPRHPEVTVLAGGSAMVFAQINAQTQRDVLLMEAIALPLSFVVLVWVFRGLFAAVLPVAIGGLAIVGSMAVLRLAAMWTDVSIFALNLTTALGLALAIDYTLLIVSRFREEIAAGADRDEALLTTMATAGRTVLFSAVTVALAMAALVLFPMYFLKSFAYAGVATVVVCATAALVITPAALVVLGPRLDALALTRRGADRPKAQQRRFWYRSATFVSHRAVAVAVGGTLLLVGMGLPFLGVAWGQPDERVLPRSASAYQVGDILRSDFAENSQTAITVVVPDAGGLDAAALDGYALAASTIPDVTAVSAPSATFADGVAVGPPAGPAGLRDGTAYLTVATAAPLFSPASEAQLDRLHELDGPGGRPVLITGIAQINRDGVAAIADRLPMVLGVIAVTTAVLLFLLTGSVVIPVKSLVLNVLSLAATFGALVWIFQDGHLGGLGTTPTGTLVVNMPVLLFCIAFGLSMDYEVFIVTRIREFWIAGQAERSVALGVAETGRVVTAAALIMGISFGALVAAQVSFMRMFGLGLTLAVLVDATLVRMMLLPAYMALLGRWNWWAPAPLARLHTALTGGRDGRRELFSTPTHPGR